MKNRPATMLRKIDKQFKEFKRYSWYMLIGGFLVFILGLVKMFYLDPSVGINLKTLQPVVSNGIILIVLGFGFFVLGLYRVVERRKAFKEQLAIDRELDEIKEKKRRKAWGYKS